MNFGFLFGLLLGSILLSPQEPKAHGLDGMNVEETLEQADGLYRSGRIEEALGLYKAVLAEDAGCGQALRMAGYILYQAYDFTEAEAFFLAHLERFGAQGYPLLNLGNIAFQRFEFSRALDYYQQALALDPEDAILLRNIELTKARIERVWRVAVLKKRATLIFRAGIVLGLVLLVSIFLLEVRFALRPARG